MSHARPQAQPPNPKPRHLPVRVWAPVLGLYAAAMIGGAVWLVRDLDQSMSLDNSPATMQTSP